MSTPMIRRRRVAGVLLGLGLFGLLIVWRTISIGAVEHERFLNIARKEHWTQETLYAQRGAIRDRSGRPLATTVHTWDIVAVGIAVRRPEQTAAALAPLLQMNQEDVLARLIEAREARKDVTIKRNVSYPVGEAIGERRLSGIFRLPRIARAYPEGDLAGSVLGFVGRDQVGLVGIEADFNRELMGRHGKAIYERDPVGTEIPLGFREVTYPTAGQDVVLTLDRFVQSVAEYELDSAIARHRASGGSIIVMDPWTGEILAMASRPSFSLLDLASAGNDLSRLRNRAVTDTYEPGSTFKALTVAAAIDQGVVTPGTTLFDSGIYQKHGVTIRNWNLAANGVIDITEVLKRSSNVGTIWVAEQLGPERFYRYVERFGFGRKTNVELGGEATGTYRTPTSPYWSPADLATNAFGQGLTVTPLQLITAQASLINGGKLMRPSIIKEIGTGPGARRFEPVVLRQTVSDQTSRTMRQLLNAAAEQGETNLALVPGYHVGGKTGTASIATAAGYATNLTIASFVGFGPVENPRAIVLIKVDEPRDQPWGSVVASPVFSAVMRQTLVYMKVPPTNARVNRP